MLPPHTTTVVRIECSPNQVPLPPISEDSDPKVCVDQSHAQATATATPSQCLALELDDRGLAKTSQPVDAEPGHGFGLSDATGDDTSPKKPAFTPPTAAEHINSGVSVTTGIASDGDASDSDSEKNPDSTGPEDSPSENADLDDSSDDDEEDDKNEPESVYDNDDWSFSDEDSASATAEVEKLKEQFENDNDTYALRLFTGKQLYQDTVDDQRIEEFLKNSPLYDHEQKCWTGLRRQQGDPKLSRTKVIDSLAEIMSSVMKELVPGVDVRRCVLRTDGLKDEGEETEEEEEDEKEDEGEDEEPLGSDGEDDEVEGDLSRFLVIAAAGPSFGRPVKGEFEFEYPGLGITNIATRVDVVCNVEDVLRAEFKAIEFWWHVVYARKFFIQQPNRRFVRTFLLDNNRILFFHFDRSGMYTKVIDGYHSHSVKTFVRLIVGLSSLDEEALGFDTSIQWKADAYGRKNSGTLKVTDDDTRVTQVYELASPHPISQSSRQIAGQLTRWLVKDPANKGATLEVTDEWKEAAGGTNDSGTSPELDLLKKLRNLDGVPQLFEYEAIQGGWQTKDSGAHNYDAPEHAPHPSNWICSRSVMVPYEVGISRFKTEVQLIGAIRDAIEGHKNMYLEAQTLHCHVAPKNIALGKLDAPPGKRGILTNINKAKPISTLVPSTVAEGQTLCLSVALLVNAFSSQSSETVLPHDYIDDLQSFFYVLTYIMHRNDGPGQKRDAATDLELDWMDSLDSLRRHRLFKQELLRATKPDKLLMGLSKSWSEASLKLLERFRYLILHAWQMKEGIRVLPNAQKCHEEDLLDKWMVRYIYDRVLSIFDIAIAQLTMDALDNGQPESPTSSSPCAKRKMEDCESSGDEDEGREARRRKVTDVQ